MFTNYSRILNRKTTHETPHPLHPKRTPQCPSYTPQSFYARVALMKRKISATMASQHPDNAHAPFWATDAFVTTREEIQECIIAFQELGIKEYKWDWEGKLVDEAVIERLFGEHYDYFKKHPLGEKHWLTFRLPNPSVETEFRLGRAFMGLLSAASTAKSVGMKKPPLFEVILPMTESAKDMLAIVESFSELSHLKHPYFDNGGLTNIEVIPLFESVHTIINSDKILSEYVSGYTKITGIKLNYLRPYVARSDPALNAGIVPTVLAIKLALSKYQAWSKTHSIPTYPIIGAACLPFRGGMDPENIDAFIDEYRGIRTSLIQSAFRYDYDKKIVKKAINRLEKRLPQEQAMTINQRDQKAVINIISEFESRYRQIVEPMAPLINKVANSVPKRRERVQHIGLFGYSRGVGQVSLPRAITFTAACYSLGLPPELFGTGRGLIWARDNGYLDTITNIYLNLKQDMIKAGNYLNKEALAANAQKHEWARLLQQDIQGIEATLQIELGPQEQAHKQHSALTNGIWAMLKADGNPQVLIEEAAKLRRSIG